MDRHRVDSDPDPNFHVDADPDPETDWHQNDADDSNVDPARKFLQAGKSDFFFTFSYSIASSQCYIFHISVRASKVS